MYLSNFIHMAGGKQQHLLWSVEKQCKRLALLKETKVAVKFNNMPSAKLKVLLELFMPPSSESDYLAKSVLPALIGSSYLGYQVRT